MGPDDSSRKRNVATLQTVLGSPNPPTAYFVGNDLTALDLIDQLETHGLAVPADVSVVGFDDIPSASLGRLSLTSLRQPIAELAEQGIARLLARIENDGQESAGVHVQKRLPLELIVRGTTSAPREHGARRKRKPAL